VTNSHGRLVWSLVWTSLKVNINFGNLHAVYVCNSVRPSVRLSVRPSVRPCMLCDQSKEPTGDIFISHERVILLVF